jgi:FKBP-type peptidyl-prolyl cis-trans isomerase SlyD
VQIQKHLVASIEYTLTDDGGQVIDTSEGRGPLTYLHGAGNLIPGLESDLEGKGVGDEFKTRIEPADAYGERNDAMVQDVPRDQLPGDMEIQVGMQFQAQGPGGMQVVTVAGIEGDTVKMDGNHPLAGVTLNFDVKIVDIREATAEEKEHGHVHGEGGHQH